MNRDFINTGILAASFLGLFGLAQILYYQFKIKAELTRKLVHIMAGLLALLFPIMLNSQWLVLLLCATFALIILASLRFNFLKSVNGIDRKSHGSIAYPVSVYCCYLVYNYYSHKNYSRADPYIYFYLPILTLAICDPVAALMGKKYPYGKFTIGKDTKTIMGSSSFFIASVVLTLAAYFVLSGGIFNLTTTIPKAFLIASVAAVSEAVSGKGIDNITIPASVVLLLILFS